MASRQRVVERVIAVIKKIIVDDDVDVFEDSKLAALMESEDWDEFARELEAEFQLEENISDRALRGFSTVRDVVDYIMQASQY